MHGFCTDFARFQNVQRGLFAAKFDKGCRNYRVKNHADLLENNDDSKLPSFETNRRLALLISGPRVRVPGGAPQQKIRTASRWEKGSDFFIYSLQRAMPQLCSNENLSGGFQASEQSCASRTERFSLPACGRRSAPDKPGCCCPGQICRSGGASSGPAPRTTGLPWRYPGLPRLQRPGLR